MALATVIMVGLSLGAATAVFHLVNRTLIAPLPFPAQERLVELGETDRTSARTPGRASLWTTRLWSTQVSSLDGVAAFRSYELPSQLEFRTARLTVRRGVASQNFLTVLELEPLCGTWFERHTSGRTVVISAALWRRAMTADCAVVGSPLSIEDRDATVIGVAPDELRLLSEADVWEVIPPGDDERASARGNRAFRAIGRIRPGSDSAVLRAEFEGVEDAAARSWPGDYEGWRTVLTPLRDTIYGNLRLPLIVILAALASLTLVAAAGVGILSLGTVLRQRVSFAVRSALGATRLRMAQESLIQALVHFCGAAIVAAMIASVAVAIIDREVPIGARPAGTVWLTALYLLALTLVSVVTGVAGPIVMSLRIPLGVLGNANLLPLRWKLMQYTLVGLQVAIASILVFCSLVFARSYAALEARSLGYAPDRVMAADVRLPVSTNASAPLQDLQLTMDDGLRLLSGAPGVERAALSTNRPLWRGRDETKVESGGATQLLPQPAIRNAVSDGYFDLMAIALVAGRGFAPSDRLSREQLAFMGRPSGAGVAILSQSLARQLYGTGNPLGRRIRLAYDVVVDREIIGIASDVHASAWEADAAHEVYVPLRQHPAFIVAALVQLRPGAGDTGDAVRAALNSWSPTLHTAAIIGVSGWVANTVAGRRFLAAASVAIGVLSVLLTTAGVIAVIHLFVDISRRDIAIRGALGASDWSVAAAILSRVGAVTVVGLLCGALVGLALRPGALVGLVQGDQFAEWAAACLITATGALVAAATGAARAIRYGRAGVPREL